MTSVGTDPRGRASVPTASAADTLAAVSEIVAPVLARGVIIRRPGAVRLEQALDLDGRAIRRMQRLRDVYGDGPLLLKLPVRDLALVLSPDHVKRVLGESPVPFSPANLEKRGALGHFQPAGVLISNAADRVDRRRFNDEVLENDRSIHSLAGPILAKVVEEAQILADQVAHTSQLHWDGFAIAWHRMVRRVVLGDAARDDHAVTDYLADLRAAANWSWLRPRRREIRGRFFRQLRGHLDRAEAGSLAALMASTPSTTETRPAHQVPQWLFAYDAAAWATFRALALLASHPARTAEVRDELSGRSLVDVHALPVLRASVLESLRLWPTTPMVLRDTTQATVWESGVLPAGAGVAIFAPYFHRNHRCLPYADRFAPEIWADVANGGPQLGYLTDEDWPLIPFSAGPVVCPGRNLVLLTASAMLGVLVQRHRLTLEQPGLLSPSRPLPTVLSPFHLRFRVS